MERSTRVILLSFILFLGFVLAALLGVFNDISQSLNIIIQQKPLPKIYFPIFFLIGLVIPLIYFLLFRDRTYVRLIINPYLILLSGQILIELVLVNLLDKWIGVIIGFVFSVLRVIQIRRLSPLSNGSIMMQLFLNVELSLWSFNTLHISLNRIWPLIFFES